MHFNFKHQISLQKLQTVVSTLHNLLELHYNLFDVTKTFEVVQNNIKTKKDKLFVNLYLIFCEDYKKASLEFD